MDKSYTESLLALDRDHVWHPYAPMHSSDQPYLVESASGVRLRLADGRELIDGMASWWSAIHGYNHPHLNRALSEQTQRMAHVMFGGLTHEPAIRLAEALVAITPEPLQSVFLADSGSVSVEVAIKMALQYWASLDRPQKHRLLTIRNGYHGDTFGAMSVCDPVNGMHQLFTGTLTEQLFAPAPTCRRDEDFSDEDIRPFADLLQRHADEIAAVILEPLVQGAGGMRFYCPEYLRRVRRLCDEHGALLIADEIATGFGRTGELFACEHAGISPDILCVGKALTGGYMTMAATLTTGEVSEVLSSRGPGVLMHGPTYMGNPLAAAVALASIELLRGGEWREQVAMLGEELSVGLKACRDKPGVVDVRVFGAIGVVELERPLDMPAVQRALAKRGVWLRPFGRLLYCMPPYVMSREDIRQLCAAMCDTLAEATA